MVSAKSIVDILENSSIRKVAENKIKQYEKTPNADLAWRVFQGYVKAAQWEKAVAWADEKQPLYEWRGKWVRGRVDIALAHMYIKDYRKASRIWSRLRGRKALFMTGFCYYVRTILRHEYF